MKKKVIILLKCLFMFGSCLQLVSQNIDIGSAAVDIKGYDVKSKKYIKLSQYKNKKNVLLNFTATYCSPCWKTYPHMDKLQQKYPSDLKVISIHGDETKDLWYKIAKRLKVNFKSATIWKVEDKEKIKKIYKIKQYPTFFIINKEGIIIDKWVGNRKKYMDYSVKYLIEP
ncbi:TlpA disulfide reductase family protein [uncultured Tenacibaculum sp.]|uniref:TlpA family protein disulfide reductase n=1 Tax=uncultured Tenacibaculum sp. TaxID=174713 RepID=UPI00260C5351|nr:TlpA disulfide reductase family protein [uncultured Tenacibaculum sp.]